MVEISVILPVYNVEDYLRQCLDSLLSQTFNDFEVICIDDGSTDNSLAILLEFEQQDNRVKVIHQKNIGVAKTRNDALNLIKGNYVYFMDADDYLDNTAFQKLYGNITSNNSDFAILKAYFVNGDEKYKYPAFDLDNEFKKADFNNFTFTYDDIKNHVLNDLFAPWFKLYNKKFILDNDITFPIIKSYSDAPFHVETMLKSDNISFLPEYLYYYRENEDSLVHSSKNTLCFMPMADCIEKILKDTNHFDEFEKEFEAFKVVKIAYYMGFSESMEFFNYSKDYLNNVEFENNDLILKKDIDKANIILDSQSVVEARLAIELYDCKRKIESMEQSKSWKVTKPLRKFTSFLK